MTKTLGQLVTGGPEGADRSSNGNQGDLFTGGPDGADRSNNGYQGEDCGGE